MTKGSMHVKMKKKGKGGGFQRQGERLKKKGNAVSLVTEKNKTGNVVTRKNLHRNIKLLEGVHEKHLLNPRGGPSNKRPAGVSDQRRVQEGGG